MRIKVRIRTTDVRGKVRILTKEAVVDKNKITFLKPLFLDNNDKVEFPWIFSSD